MSWLHLGPCLVPSWCGASRTMWDCYWPWWGFRFILCLPRDLPQRKSS